jgi:hypothetical protein
MPITAGTLLREDLSTWVAVVRNEMDKFPDSRKLTETDFFQYCTTAIDTARGYEQMASTKASKSESEEEFSIIR